MCPYCRNGKLCKDCEEAEERYAAEYDPVEEAYWESLMADESIDTNMIADHLAETAIKLTTYRNYWRQEAIKYRQDYRRVCEKLDKLEKLARRNNTIAPEAIRDICAGRV